MADGCREWQELGQRIEQATADVPRKPVGAAQEHRRLWVVRASVTPVVRPELLRFEAVGTGFMADVMIGAPADKRPAARRPLQRPLRAVFDPQPSPPPDNSMHRALHRPPYPQPPHE